jgi:hypothetical protein
VYLKNKGFFRKERITEVSLETNRPAPSDYRDHIEVNRASDKIEIMNYNSIEVRGFPLELPTSITPDKLLAYSAYFANWQTVKGQQDKIVAFLSPIGPCISGKPGKKAIPLK